MKMHFTFPHMGAPIGFDFNARGTSRLAGLTSAAALFADAHSQVSSAQTGQPVTDRIRPQPFGRSRRF